MLKTWTIAACILAATGGMATAQSGASGSLLAGPGPAPGGARGAAPVQSIGTPAAIGQNTAEYGTQSTSVLSQTIKNESAAGMDSSVYTPRAQRVYGTVPRDPNGVGSPQIADRYGYYERSQPTVNRSQGNMPDTIIAVDSADPRTVVIVDEYGYQYNIEGKRIGKVAAR